MSHAPPPPSKRKNHHQILNMYFSLFTFRVELGFGKLNKHKNEKKERKGGGEYTACCSERSCKKSRQFSLHHLL